MNTNTHKNGCSLDSNVVLSIVFSALNELSNMFVFVLCSSKHECCFYWAADNEEPLTLAYFSLEAH